MASDPQLTPDEDIAVAREALAEGDLKHAVYHVGCALSADPNRSEWLALLEQILTIAPDPLQLAPLVEESYFATGAVHAYILARARRLTEAIDVLLQVVLHKPEVPYLDWAIAWIQQPEAAGTLRLEKVTWFFGQVVEKLPQWTLLESGGKVTLDRIWPLIRAIRATQPPNSMFLFIGASLVRRLGMLDQALELANESYRVEPAYHSAVAVAGALKARDLPDQAIEWYRAALYFQPQDVPIHLDIGDMLWEKGDLEGAERAYTEALQREPQQPWALPSYYAVRYCRTGEKPWKETLEGYAQANPDNERARELARRFLEYFGSYLPEPREATISVFRKVITDIQSQGSGTPSGNMKVMVNWLEAPSAFLAIRQQIAVLGWPCTPQFNIQDVQTPDTRKPRDRVDYLLWKYQGTSAIPALPPPPQAVWSAVGGIANQPYHLPTWWGWAGPLAARLGPAQIQNLLAVMVHPPPPPSGMWAWNWVLRLQIAAALVIGRLDAGWQNSVRKKALFALANGPMDWTVQAAILALTLIALENPEAAADVLRLFHATLMVVPKQGYTCYLDTLLCGYMQLPGVSGPLRQELQSFRQSLT